MTGTVSIRRARLWQMPSLLGILWSYTRATPWLPQGRGRHTDAALMLRLLARGAVRVVHDARGPVGFIARQDGFIQALYVHPRGRGQGIGAALLAEAQSRSDALELWTLQANAPARAFYAAHGFVEIAETAGWGNDEGLPDVHLTWQKEAPA